MMSRWPNVAVSAVLTDGLRHRLLWNGAASVRTACDMFVWQPVSAAPQWMSEQAEFGTSCPSCLAWTAARRLQDIEEP